MLDLAVSVATGTPWLDLFDCPVPGRVLLFAGEGTEAELMFRVLAVCEHKGIRPRDLAGLIRTAASVPRFMDKDDMDILTMELESFEPSLCLIDPAYVALRGAQQGSLTDIGERLEPIRTATQDAGVTLTLAWHWNQTGVGSGPQRFTGAGAAEWGRFLGSAKLERKWREDGVLNSQKLYDWSGSEIPDFQFRVTQRVWSDDPDDINSLLHYDVVANEVHSDPGEDWKPTFYMAKVSRFVETEAEPPSLNRICDVVTGKKEFKRQAVAALVRDGYLRVEDGPRGSQLHHFIKPYLEPQK